LLVLLYSGTFDPTVWRALEMYLVPLVAGIFVGTLSFRMFSSEAYARAVSALVVVSGFALCLH
jgi:positive regulator of sigma E activity